MTPFSICSVSFSFSYLGEFRLWSPTFLTHQSSLFHFPETTSVLEVDFPTFDSITTLPPITTFLRVGWGEFCLSLSRDEVLCGSYFCSSLPLFLSRFHALRRLCCGLPLHNLCVSPRLSDVLACSLSMFLPFLSYVVVESSGRRVLPFRFSFVLSLSATSRCDLPFALFWEPMARNPFFSSCRGFSDFGDFGLVVLLITPGCLAGGLCTFLSFFPFLCVWTLPSFLISFLSGITFSDFYPFPESWGLPSVIHM